MKAKIVKAEVFTRWRRVVAQAMTMECQIADEVFEGFIVKCPHNWTITARPPTKAKGKKKGVKK